MPASKYTEAQRAEALKLYHTKGPTAAGEQLGIPKETIMSWAKKAGVHTVRTSRTREATAARAVDLKSRRQELTALLLEDAHKLREQLWQPTVAFSFGGKDNTYEEAQIPEPTFGDKKNIMSAVGIAVDRVVKLEAVDAGAASEAGVNMLTALAEAFGVRDA